MTELISKFLLPISPKMFKGSSFGKKSSNPSIVHKNACKSANQRYSITKQKNKILALFKLIMRVGCILCIKFIKIHYIL